MTGIGARGLLGRLGTAADNEMGSAVVPRDLADARISRGTCPHPLLQLLCRVVRRSPPFSVALSIIELAIEDGCKIIRVRSRIGAGCGLCTDRRQQAGLGADDVLASGLVATSILLAVLPQNI